MKNGYEIQWTDFALDELKKTIEHLEQNWTEKEIKKFVVKREETLKFISKNPNIYQASEVKNEIRRVVITYK